MADLEPLSPEEGVKRFLDWRESSLRDSSLYNARTRLTKFLEWCTENDVENLNDLTGRQLAAFVSWRRKDISAITLQKQLSTIRQALRYWADIEAVENGLAEKVHAPELPDGAESRDVHIEPDRAKFILEELDRRHYSSRDHVLFSLLWRTGMRRSAVRSIDVDDLRPDEHAVVLRHRPEQGTQLKNGEAGERWLYLGPRWFQILDDHLDHGDRYDVTDDYGRRPLLTTRYGRPAGNTIYEWVIKLTHPCRFGSCPHNREPEDCEALGTDARPARCPSARSPHAIRRGAITHYLNEDTSPEIVSERMDVKPRRAVSTLRCSNRPRENGGSEGAPTKPMTPTHPIHDSQRTGTETRFSSPASP
jgi:site-specific recombinase XerD